MITILRGPRAALLAEAARLAREGGAIVLPSDSPRAWNGVRHLLEELGKRLGSAALEERLAPFRAASSLVLGHPADELSEDERRRRSDFAARPDSHLSHNLLVQRPFFRGVAAILDATTRDCGAPVVVPDLALLDRESLGALRTLYRRFPETAPDLVAGFDPGFATPAPDGNGLAWEHEAEEVWRIALGWLSVLGSRFVEVSDLAGEKATAAALPTPMGDGLDERAFALLAQGGLSADEVGQVLAGQRAAFESYAFTTALRLGLGLLAARPELTQEQAADLHGLIALSAHNRQFLTRGNQPLADFLERHLRVAWEAETRPALRSALSYRLAVTLARRQKRFAEALDWVDEAVAAADSRLSRLQSAHLEAWGENIRALALLRSGREAEAMESCERAFARLDAAIEGKVEEAAVSSDALLREVAFTHALLADNLAALYHREGGERFIRWKAEGDRIAEPFPDLLRFEAITWIELYRSTGQLGAALAKAQKGLTAARAEQDAIREYTYAVHVADLHDRRGQAREAFEAFTVAQELRRRLGNPRFLRDMVPHAAAAALRGGFFDEAEHRFAELLGGIGLSLDARAQLLAAWGEVAAGRGDEPAAESRLNAAIAAAVESGERDSLLAVAVAAGRAMQILGKPEEARDAYRRALEIAETGEEDRPVPPALELAALLGMIETEGPAADLALRALGRFAEALDDADAWWEVERLEAAIDRAGCRERAETECAEAVARLRRAGAERSGRRHFANARDASSMELA